MQTTDRAIKIIKREHRDAVELERAQSDPSLKTESEIRREILNTITSWVEHQREARKELLEQSSFFKRDTFASSLLASLNKIESEPELL